MDNSPIPNQITQQVFNAFSGNLERRESEIKISGVDNSKLNDHFQFLYKYRLLNKTQERHQTEKVTQGENYQDANQFNTINEWLEFRNTRQEKEQQLIDISIKASDDTISTNKVTREHIEKIEDYNDEVVRQTKWTIRLSGLSLLTSMIVGFYVVRGTFQEDRIYLVPTSEELKTQQLELLQQVGQTTEKLEALELKLDELLQGQKTNNVDKN